MIEWTKLDWFAFGLALGWFANPIWRLLTRILKEAKIAKQEWRNPSNPLDKRNRDEHAP
jgi:hypothetical protein